MTTSRLLLIVAASSIGCGCSDRSSTPDPVPTPSKPPGPDIAVSWGGTHDVYAVLGKDPSLLQAVQVPRRHLAHGTTVQPTSIGGYHVATTCDRRYCVDGIVPDDQLVNSTTLKPCTVHADRSRVARFDAKGGVCTFLVRPARSGDDEEILGTDDGSWLERGISITHIDGEWVSFFEAQADFTAGAAHSNAELRCRSLAAIGVDHLDAYFDRETLERANSAVHSFIARARVDSDRAFPAPALPDDIATTRSFLITGPRSFVLSPSRPIPAARPCDS